MTAESYLANLPAERRAVLEPMLQLIREKLPAGYEESLAFGMIAWQVPLAVYPDTYNKQPLLYAALASQKNHLAVYLCSVYGSENVREQFLTTWKQSGKKLDMGKSCVRFKRLEDVALDAVAEAIAACSVQQFVAHAQAVRAAGSKR